MTDNSEVSSSHSGQTNISYDVNLNFDTRATNHNGQTQDQTSNSQGFIVNEATSNSAFIRSTTVCDDVSGKSHDNRHSQTPNSCNGNSRTDGSVCGKPRGNRHGLNSSAGLRNNISSGYCSGQESNRQTLKVDGKPRGNRHSAGKPILEDSTTVRTSADDDLYSQAIGHVNDLVNEYLPEDDIQFRRLRKIEYCLVRHMEFG